MKHLILILATVVISASAGAGTTAYILDYRWSQYVGQMAQVNDRQVSRLKTDHADQIDRLNADHAEQLDRLNIEHTEQIERLKAEQETWRKGEFARGFWRGVYTICYVVLNGDGETCLRGVRAGYQAGDHLKTPAPGWNWLFVWYKPGQVQY